MKPDDYNWKQIQEGTLDAEHVTAMTRIAQAKLGLTVDGCCGPITQVALVGVGIETWPMRALSDGRAPVVTSAYRTEDRPTHDGVDILFQYLKNDPPMKAGDGGAVVKRGRRKWWVPSGTQMLSVGRGVVTLCGPHRTGFRCWVDHENGWRVGYFHMSGLAVRTGSRVNAGDVLGVVGDNPNGFDPVHVHLELSPSDRYAPVDPEPYLNKVKPLPAL